MTTNTVTEILVPAREARAFRVARGDLLEIVDVEGQHVADFISIFEHNPRELMSATHTRSATLRLNLAVGDRIQTNWRNSVYEVVSDDAAAMPPITPGATRPLA